MAKSKVAKVCLGGVGGRGECIDRFGCVCGELYMDTHEIDLSPRVTFWLKIYIIVTKTIQIFQQALPLLKLT